MLTFAVLWAGAAVFAAVNPPVLKWSRGGCTSWCQTGWYSSPAVADLDNDGQQEVIWGSYDVVALTGTSGALEWRGPNGSRVWPGVVVADLTGDGTLEVIVGRGSNQVTVYRADGTLHWTGNPFGGGEIRTLAVADLDGDGPLEIVVGSATNVDSEQLSVFNAGGSVRAGWPARRAGDPGYGSGMYNENVAVADFDGDGYKEIFGPTDTHYITALDRNGNQLTVNAMYTGRTYWSQVGVHVDHAVDVRGWAYCGTEHRPNFADSAPIVADLDGNGTLELIVVGNVYNCGTNPYTSLYRMPFIFSLDRTRWAASGYDWTVLPTPPAGAAPRSEDWTVIESSVANPVAADLDNDGKLEILFPSYDGRLHAYWLDKTQHGAWPFTVPFTGGADNYRYASEPAVADLDNDGAAEVIFTSWPKKATNLVGHLHILDSLGHELQRVALPTPSSTICNGGLGAPTLADIDGDGELEAVVGTSATGLVAYDLPGTANTRILWGTGRGNQQRTGEAPRASWPPGSFYKLTPCRVIDTRNPNGPVGGPILAASGTRSFTITGHCSVPSDAKAISANLTVVGASAVGDLRVIGGHLTSTLTSALSIPITRARANNALVQLSTAGNGTINVINSSSGTVHFILDVNGYFR
jgi:hypothetical protein